MSKVKVAGIEYTIREVPKLLESFGYYGVIHYHTGEIQVDSNLSKERKMQVIVHELLHAIFYESGFEEHSEDMVNRLAITLHQVIVDNGEALRNGLISNE